MIISSKVVAVTTAVLALAASCEDRAAPGTATTTAAASDSGEVSSAGASMRWQREGDTLRYSLTYEASSSCYSAGPTRARITQPGNTVVINADIAFAQGICAQSITSIPFEGTMADVTSPFAITAIFKDIRSGRITTLVSPSE